jgi:antitoxin MazE
MDLTVIKIGNSKGIRLSKTIIEKYEITDSIEVILEKNQIILKPKNKPRKGWAKLFKKMHDNRDDRLILPDVFHDETLEEWS